MESISTTGCGTVIVGDACPKQDSHHRDAEGTEKILFVPPDGGTNKNILP
jgi:hypothetical protein